MQLSLGGGAGAHESNAWMLVVVGTEEGGVRLFMACGRFRVSRVW